MVRADLCMMSVLDPRVLTDMNKLMGYDVTKGVRNSNKVQSEPGKILGYLKALQDVNSDISEVDHLLKLVHFGFLIAGGDYDIMEIQGWCSLPQINAPGEVRGITTCFFTGTGEEWQSVLRHCCNKSAPPSVKEFGIQVHSQFRRINFKIGNFEVKSDQLVLK